MTRETKIGLLVGLVFIIVVGVLLSDHLVNATDPKPAAIADVGKQVLEGIANPGSANPHNGTTIQPGNVAPSAPVQTSREMANAQPAGSAKVEIGPAPLVDLPPQANPDVPMTRTTVTGNPTRGPVELDDNGATVRVTPALGAGSTPTPVLPLAGGEPDPTAGAPTVVTIPPAPKMQEYKAQAGDTVAKMAKKLYGADTKANRDRIIAANPTLKADPRKVVVNKVYNIPVKESAGDAAGHAGATLLAPTTNPAAASTSASSGERIYIVKSGDNIWKIAKEQLHNGNAADEIRKLNRDVLKNGDNLKVGMKLRLPAKKD